MFRRFPILPCIAPLALFFLTLCPSLRAHADTVTIGSGGCNYIGFQFALDQLAGRPGPHEIRLRAQTFSVPEGLTLNAATTNWTIRGGYANCSDANPTPGQRSIIDASGGSDGTALAINANSTALRRVTLDNLTIRGGSAETGPFTNPEGGGIEARGHVYIRLQGATFIESNASGKGAGVFIKGKDSTHPATLQLLGSSSIEDNIAQSDGGGIYCENDAAIYLDDGEVSFNQAGANGGGLYLLNACKLDTVVAAGSFTGINNNQADKGAGLYANSYSPMTLRGASNAPFWFIGNTASSIGGAMSVENAASTRAAVNLYTTVFMGNQALGGSAISTIGNVDVLMRPRDGHTRCSFFGVSYGACSAVVGNEGNPIYPFRGGNGPTFRAQRTAFLDNDGGYLIFALLDSPTSVVDIENSLIKGNHVDWALFLIDNDASSPNESRIAWSTVTGNTPGTGNYMLRHYQTPMDLTGSIFYNPGFTGRTGDSTGTISHFGCLLVHSSATWPSTPVAPLVGNPILAADLSPPLGSPAIDVCYSGGAPATDFYGNPRVVDQPGEPNLHGPVDLGAIELPVDDVIFANGFE